MLKIKEYVKAESLEQAYELNQKKTNWSQEMYKKQLICRVLDLTRSKKMMRNFQSEQW